MLVLLITFSNKQLIIRYLMYVEVTGIISNQESLLL